MPKIDSAGAAIGHLYAFRDDPKGLATELENLATQGSLSLSGAELAEVCQFWKIDVPPAFRDGGKFAKAYGADPGFSPAQSTKEAGGAAGAQTKAATFKSTIGWSDFAKGRHRPGRGYSYFKGSDAELTKLVKAHWDERVPGQDRTNLDEVVVVPVPPEDFACATVRVKPNTKLDATLFRRQEHEDPYVRVVGEGHPEPANFAKVVLYSAEALLENGGTRSTDSDWEVVAIIASPVDDEPMHPLTMARNMLSKPGGTPVEYTARALAESIYYWSQRVSVKPDSHD